VERFDNGRFVPGLNGTRRVPFNLPAILKAELVFVVEGEKDCETLGKIGLTATTSPFGAGKWIDDYAQYFKNKLVVVIPDNDEVGREHALKAARSILPQAKDVKLVELSDVPEKGDVTDYLSTHTRQGLERLINVAESFTETGAQFVSSPKENKPCAINIPLQTWTDFLSTDFTDQPFTIEGIAPEAGLIAFHGRGKDGKTTLLIHGCRAIASG
jgi:5S rRNA maturation endonuclease (ribonuclease M5)